jgi:hypothetical protein
MKKTNKAVITPRSKSVKKKVVKRVTKAQLEAIELQKELEEVCSWKAVSGEKVLRLYDLNKKIFNDNFKHCTKCPAAIRNVFKKIKIYHEQNKTA